jgi:hypothetical protein
MSATHLDLDASELAGWLAKHGGDRLWTVDGDPRIMGTVSLPCSGRELAATLNQLGGRLRVFAPAGAQASSPDELEKLAELEYGELVFEVAWLREDGTPEQRWMLAQDTFAERAMQAALAAPDKAASPGKLPPHQGG